MSRAMTTYLLTTVAFWLVAASPAIADEVCFQCHDRGAFTGEIVHEPVSQLKCGACHNPHVARYSGLLHKREDMLCYSCHEEQEQVYTSGHVHEPVAGGNCSACHTPHVSSSPGLVRENLSEQCFTCHEKMVRDFPVPHAPFARGQCTKCHNPHQAGNLDLLADATDGLCAGCHQPGQIAEGHRNFPAAPADCLSCHNPHGSEREALVRNVLHPPYEKGCDSCHQGGATGISMEACLKCHEVVRGQMLATRSHLTLQEGNSCLGCHSPHAGDTQALLKSGDRQICTPCHEDTLAGYSASEFRHPDIRKCSNCHESHGSTHLAMLKGNGNEVCVECHKTQGKFSHPVGPEVLDTYTGQMITCITCHKPMGTDYQFHLVLDGNKELCVQCHRSY